MMYRIDTPANEPVSSGPTPHVPVSPTMNSEVVYTAGVSHASVYMDPGSVVVMASMPDWSNATPPLHVEAESIVETTPVAKPAPDADHAQPAQPSTEASHPHSAEPAHSANEVDSPQARTEPATDFRPAWEVDQLLWPEFCEELYVSEAEYFRHAGQKLNAACRQGLRVLAVASSHAGEGCTTLAMCLARAVSAAGGRVALVDANTEHPAMSSSLGLEFSRGWQEVAAHKLPLSEVAVVSNADGITLFPLDSGHDSLEPSRVSEVLREASAAADLVILDAGPHTSGDTCLFERGSACPVDAAIIVRDLRKTTEQTTLATAENLKRLGVEAVGIAENYAPKTADAAA